MKRTLRSIMLILVVAGFGALLPARAANAVETSGHAAPIDPGAGPWQTWVLTSPDEFRLPAPPDRAATAEEIADLKALAASRDEAAMRQIAYWNAGPPAYRWNQIALDAMLKREIASQAAYRDLALLHVAIYDATAAAWDTKYAYHRARPSEVDPSLDTAIPNPVSPSYPCEVAVTAGAASAVLSWLFPEDAAHFEELAQAAAHSRLVAGVEYPSDVEAGLRLGRQVAELVIARGKSDGYDAQWTGSVPTEAGKWTGENPVTPAAASWQTWVLTSPDQFRPAPPPAYDSPELATEMDELRRLERTPATNSAALFWEWGAGGRRNYWFWNDEATRAILEANLHNDPVAAAQIYALANIAGHDSVVACWDAKYAYWAPRPFQIDPSFTPLFNTPNHPSYPSAHSCLSTAVADVLSYFFPADAERFMRLAEEAGETRILAGIHFRSDVEAGTALGKAVGDAVIARAMHDDPRGGGAVARNVPAGPPSAQAAFASRNIPE